MPSCNLQTTFYCVNKLHTGGINQRTTQMQKSTSTALSIMGYVVSALTLPRNKIESLKKGNLQFYIPGFQNDPSYPKQKEFLKSTEGNLK